MGELETMEGVSCAAAKAAALRVLRVPELAGKVFLEGGLVPWVLGGRESGPNWQPSGLLNSACEAIPSAMPALFCPA